MIDQTWNKFSEKKPQVADDYLVTHNCPICEMVGNLPSYQVAYWDEVSWHIDESVFEQITHWCEFPRLIKLL